MHAQRQAADAPENGAAAMRKRYVIAPLDPAQGAPPEPSQRGDMSHAEQRRARLLQPRLARELKTIDAMLRIYCRDHHGAVLSSEPHGVRPMCADCAVLLTYAEKRLAGCPYGEEKPTCANCRIHCYGPVQREQVRQVMRHAGPRMLLRHPYLALEHIADGRRPAPGKPRGLRTGDKPGAVAPAETPAQATGQEEARPS